MDSIGPVDSQTTTQQTQETNAVSEEQLVNEAGVAERDDAEAFNDLMNSETDTKVSARSSRDGEQQEGGEDNDNDDGEEADQPIPINEFVAGNCVATMLNNPFIKEISKDLEKEE